MNTLDTTVHRENTPAQTAPWLPIPSRAISVVEHPCLVKNIDKGIVSLGGPVKLSKVRSPPSGRQHHHHNHRLPANTTPRP